MSTATAAPRIPGPAATDADRLYNRHLIDSQPSTVKWITRDTAQVDSGDGQVNAWFIVLLAPDAAVRCNCYENNRATGICPHVTAALNDPNRPTAAPRIPAIRWIDATHARIESEKTAGKFYDVSANFCTCEAFYYHVSRNPEYICKHQRRILCSLCHNDLVYNGFTFCQTCAAAELASALKSAPRLCDWCHQDIARQAGNYCSDKCQQAACADGLLDLVPSVAMTEPEQPMVHCQHCQALYAYFPEYDELDRWLERLYCPPCRPAAASRFVAA